jgi:hypothetical protein
MTKKKKRSLTALPVTPTPYHMIVDALTHPPRTNVRGSCQRNIAGLTRVVMALQKKPTKMVTATMIAVIWTALPVIPTSSWLIADAPMHPIQTSAKLANTVGRVSCVRMALKMVIDEDSFNSTMMKSASEN